MTKTYFIIENENQRKRKSIQISQEFEQEHKVDENIENATYKNIHEESIKKRRQRKQLKRKTLQ